MGFGVFLPLYEPCTVAIHALVASGGAVCFTCHKDVPHLRGHAVRNRRDASSLIPRTSQALNWAADQWCMLPRVDHYCYLRARIATPCGESVHFEVVQLFI